MSSYIQSLTAQESNRQKNSLNLIASENYPSPEVLECLGSVWSLKYGEGYPGKRYYAGNEYTDELEVYTLDKVLEIFNSEKLKLAGGIANYYSANLQVLSGSQANSAVFLGVLEPGDKILSMNLANGGHLSHLHATSVWNKFFGHVEYDIKAVQTADTGQNYEIDLEDFEQKLKAEKPRLTIIGASSYPRQIDFEKMIKIAHQYGSLVLCDIAHISGLIISGLHPSPFSSEALAGADFVTTTTHKTFRGPRGAILYSKKEFATQIDKSIFPGSMGGPFFNKIAAIARASEEILGIQNYPDGIGFDVYSGQVVDNCKILENHLQDTGIEIISPTQNHLCLIKLPEGKDSIQIQKKLEKVGIICNRNVIPFDSKSPWRPSGIRLGTAAITSRMGNLKNPQEIIKSVASLISDTILDKQTESFVENKVSEITALLNWFY